MRRSILIATFVITIASTILLVHGCTYDGPHLIAGYNFMNSLSDAEVANQANGGPWPQIHDTCTLCHGSKGLSLNTQYPQLAGQSASYIEAQLHAFAEGKRESPLMHPLAAMLSDAQITSLGIYFSRQSPGLTEMEANKGHLAQSGRDLVAAKGCYGCHGAHLEGGPLAPRIGGLGDRYLNNQITAFKQGRRIDPTHAMNSVASGLTDQEIIAVVYFVASQNPVIADSQSK
ncbi:c-type cytochrome [Pseudomonas sp. TH49]|uniref:c-type cytochrome n=1 Tax=Pseudomonas sp. TH49 TaxID=2796413 RepID=UPI001911EB8F|nr:c-type cytochrome [Pseudomonas sp. TH49]MBK5344640.1 c-type cytochrome [Pseudomonas sp. TH49]